MTGIMLLITLLLTLELVGRKEKTIQAEETTTHLPTTPSDPEQLQKEIAALKQRVAELKSENARFAKLDERQLQAELRKAENENLRRREKLRDLKRKLAEAERRKTKATATDAPGPTTEQIEREIHDTAAKLKKLRNSGRIFMQAPEGAKKRNWLVEISKTGARAAMVGRESAAVSFSGPDAFGQWLETRDRSADHLVLFVKSGGIGLFKEISRLIDAKGFSKGFDVQQPGATVLDEKTGAAVP